MPEQRPSCFGSPTAFNPNTGSWCRGCAHFNDCARVSLGKVVALARSSPLQDLADTLETQLRGLGVAGCASDGGEGQPDQLELSGDAPERSFGRIKRKELIDDETKLLASLPVKVAKRMRPLMRAGLFRRLGPEMRAGRNPFPEYENEFLRRMAGWILDRGEVSKINARAGYMQAYGWTEGTASAHVSVACCVMATIDVAEDRGDRIVRKW
jgi:hypothetical protein